MLVQFYNLNIGDVEQFEIQTISWLKPQVGYFKINFDGFFDPYSEMAIVGFIVHDWEGH